MKKGGWHTVEKIFTIMKLNKTLMIAALVAGGVFAADMAARAQETTNTPPASTRPIGGARARGPMNFEFISTQLSLTEDQKAKAKPMFQEMGQKLTELRKDTTLSQADRRAKFMEIRNDLTTKLSEVLTPDQLEKWKKMGPPNRTRPAATPGAQAKPPQ